jgi:hypothetical protein
VSEPPVDEGRDGPVGPVFWVSAAVGLAIVCVGAVNLFAVTPAPRRLGVVTFVVGAGVAHDAIWAPLAVVLGALTRLLPPVVRLPVRVGLALTALVVLVTWPVVRGYARTPRNPSILPLDYATNLTWAVVLIWLGVAGSVLLRSRRWRRS